ncbi:hypothetical protein GCM10009628_11580 [Paeniglutamicibacter kerguelensis]
MSQPMPRKSNRLDNAVMENFFGHLQEEMFLHHEFTGTEGLLAEHGDYIRWYNHDRISLTPECLGTKVYRPRHSLRSRILLTESNFRGRVQLLDHQHSFMNVSLLCVWLRHVTAVPAKSLVSLGRLPAINMQTLITHGTGRATL